MMEKLIASLADTLTRFIEAQKRPTSDIGKDIKSGAGTGIIILITENLACNHHKDSIKVAGIIIVISI